MKKKEKSFVSAVTKTQARINGDTNVPYTTAAFPTAAVLLTWRLELATNKTEYAVRWVKYTLHCNTLPRAYQAKVG